MTEAALAAVGVHRLPIPIPFTAAGGPVNVYAIEEASGGLLLFDAGLGTPEAQAALEAGLRALGRGLDEVTRIVVSHGHVDHYGAARFVQERHGGALPVFVHEGDEGKVSEAGPGWSERAPVYAAYLRRQVRQSGDVGANPSLQYLVPCADRVHSLLGLAEIPRSTGQAQKVVLGLDDDARRKQVAAETPRVDLSPLHRVAEAHNLLGRLAQGTHGVDGRGRARVKVSLGRDHTWEERAVADQPGPHELAIKVLGFPADVLRLDHVGTPAAAPGGGALTTASSNSLAVMLKISEQFVWGSLTTCR